MTFELTQERRHQATDRIGGRIAAVLLDHDQGDDLAAASHEVGQETISALQDRPNRWLDLLAEEREQSRIDGVGLRQHPHAFTETPDATRVDHHDRQPRFGELGDQAPLVASRGLHDDSRGFEGSVDLFIPTIDGSHSFATLTFRRDAFSGYRYVRTKWWDIAETPPAVNHVVLQQFDAPVGQPVLAHD